MWYFWLMAAIGLMMAVGGATRATWMPYRWLHARAGLLWKAHAHTALLVAGIIVTVLGALAALGILWP